MPANSSEQTVAVSAAIIDTGLIPEPARLDFWNRVNTESFSGISVDPRSDNLHGVLERRECGALKLRRIYSTAAVVHGGQCSQYVNRDTGLLLHMQDRGNTANTQLRRSAALRAGDITFCDASRPYTVECAAPVRLIVAKIPYDVLSSRFESIDELLGLHVDGTRGSGAMLASFLRNAWEHCDEIDAGEAGFGESMLSALLDLMAPLQRARSKEEHAPNFVALRREMRAYLEQRLADPDLSVESLADAFGVTARHVHRVFAEAGTTPLRHILDRRLDLAAHRLRNMKRGENITSIAFDSGFNGSTTFCRAFRKRFGLTPREYRRERA